MGLGFIQRNQDLGGYGWSVLEPEGHEVITLKAIGPARQIDFLVSGVPMKSTLSPAEVNTLVAGNRSVDLGWMGTGLLFSLNKDEQRRHALRREYGQALPAALRDIISSLSAQHRAVLAEPNPMERMRRIGMATHLVQDSFSPAHTERQRGSGWCISYIRNFGKGTSPREHGIPRDSRDYIAESGMEADQAVVATRKYLEIAVKAIYGKVRPSPAAVSEAASEFDRFAADVLRLC